MKYINLKVLVSWILSRCRKDAIILTSGDLNYVIDISGSPDDFQVCNCDTGCIMKSDMCIFFDMLENENDPIHENSEIKKIQEVKTAVGNTCTYVERII